MEDGDQVIERPRYRGRALDVSQDEAEQFARGPARELIQRYATANADNGYNGLSPSIRRTKAQSPDLNRAGAKAITEVMAKDLQGMVDTHGSDRKYTHMGIRHRDGTESSGGMTVGPAGEAQRQGQWVTTRSDGIRQSVTDYQDDHKHGVELLYTDKGHLKAKSMYAHGVKHGEEMQYDNDGKPTRKVMYERGQAKQSFGLEKQNGANKLPTFLRGR